MEVQTTKQETVEPLLSNIRFVHTFMYDQERFSITASLPDTGTAVCFTRTGPVEIRSPNEPYAYRLNREGIGILPPDTIAYALVVDGVLVIRDVEERISRLYVGLNTFPDDHTCLLFDRNSTIEGLEAMLLFSHEVEIRGHKIVTVCTEAPYGSN